MPLGRQGVSKPAGEETESGGQEETREGPQLGAQSRERAGLGDFTSWQRAGTWGGGGAAREFRGVGWRWGATSHGPHGPHSAPACPRLRAELASHRRGPTAEVGPRLQRALGMTRVWGSLALTATPGCVRTSVPQEELPEPFEHLLQRIARRPKPQQFFGLMGKRDAGEMGSHPLCLCEPPTRPARSFSERPVSLALRVQISSLEGVVSLPHPLTHAGHVPAEGGRHLFVRPQG